MFPLQYRSIAHYPISDGSLGVEITYHPQSSHHALIISFPSIPFTVCVFGSGPSCLMTAFGVKIWAECLSTSALDRVVLKYDLQSSSPSTAICTIYFISSSFNGEGATYDRDSCESPHLVEVSYIYEHCSCSVLLWFLTSL